MIASITAVTALLRSLKDIVQWKYRLTVSIWSLRSYRALRVQRGPGWSPMWTGSQSKLANPMGTGANQMALISFSSEISCTLFSCFWFSPMPDQDLRQTSLKLPSSSWFSCSCLCISLKICCKDIFVFVLLPLKRPNQMLSEHSWWQPYECSLQCILV